MNKWIAEFDLEDGDKMPEHMDLEYKGAKIDFHCRPLEQEPTTKNDLEVGDLLPKYINALRKCAKEHEKDFVPTFNIITTDLCNDTAKLLEQIHHQRNILAYAHDFEVSVEQAEKELRVEKTDMIDKSNFSQEQYKADLQSAYDCGYAQAKTDLGVDCIDKTELLKAMDTWDKFGNDPNVGLIPLRTPALQDRYVPYVKYDDMVNCVKNMPSVTPQPRKGHWIEHPHEAGLNWQYSRYECSECHDWADDDSDFCPNCGADMREVGEK